jgi:hypothetical protein
MQNRYFDRPLPTIAASGFVETGCGARWYYARFDQMVEQFVQDRVSPQTPSVLQFCHKFAYLGRDLLKRVCGKLQHQFGGAVAKSVRIPLGSGGY